MIGTAQSYHTAYPKPDILKTCILFIPLYSGFSEAHSSGKKKKAKKYQWKEKTKDCTQIMDKYNTSTEKGLLQVLTSFPGMRVDCSPLVTPKNVIADLKLQTERK